MSTKLILGRKPDAIPRLPPEPIRVQIAVYSVIMEATLQTKAIDRNHVRQQLRKQRKQLSTKTIQQNSAIITKRILMFTELINAKKIGVYVPQENEVDTHTLITHAFNANKRLYLPIIITQPEKQLRFCQYHHNDTLIKNKWGIEEPTQRKNTIEPEALDLLVLPLVGFDAQCNRLGRGAGFYDRALHFRLSNIENKTCLMGLGYEFQKLDSLTPLNPWDVPLDMVVTEKMVYRACL